MGVIAIEPPSGVRVRVGRRGRWRHAGARASAGMIAPGPAARIHRACGATGMRKGFDGPAVLVRRVLAHDPHRARSSRVRGKRGGLRKLLWRDG